MASRHRGDVDGLRALAVTAVIIYHIDKSWLPGGFTGVDVFFVISGFVVAGSLLNRAGTSRLSDFLLGFYARRVKRLTPSLLCMVLCTSLAVAVLIDPETITAESYYITAQYALLGWANNHFAAQETGYGATGAASLEFNPFTHTWSLGVEEQFYFVFPLLMALFYGQRIIAKGEGGRSCSCCPHLWLPLWLRSRPMLGLASTFAASLGVSAWLSVGHEGQQQLAFYLVPCRFWQLILGAMLFAWQEDGRAATALGPLHKRFCQGASFPPSRSRRRHCQRRHHRNERSGGDGKANGDGKASGDGKGSGDGTRHGERGESTAAPLRLGCGLTMRARRCPPRRSRVVPRPSVVGIRRLRTIPGPVVSPCGGSNVGIHCFGVDDAHTQAALAGRIRAVSSAQCCAQLRASSVRRPALVSPLPLALANLRHAQLDCRHETRRGPCLRACPH